MATFEWTLDVVTRCEALQALLTTSDRTALQSVLQHSSVRGNVMEQQQQSEAQDASTAHAAAAATSSHLKRWKQWKLEDAHIERLTSPQSEDVAAQLLRTYVRDARFFARGKRGVLYAGELLTNNAGVVMKLGAASVEPSGVATLSASSAIDAEAKWLCVMNRMGIGAQLHASGPGWILCERLDGRNVVDFLSATTTTHAHARWVLREMLCQCFAMDLMRINKDEMTHPHRHIIVHASSSAGAAVSSKAASFTQQQQQQQQQWRCTFIDFEKCTYTTKPKNVTQLCQFLTSPRMVALFCAKSVTIDVQRVRQATRTYKQSKLIERAFRDIMRVFELE